MGQENPKRPSVKVEDSPWTQYFISPKPLPCQDKPLIKNRWEKLVRKVRCMIQEYVDEDKDFVQGMKTVDSIERLGVGYHFEKEIGIFMDLVNSKPATGDDLCAAALQFRLLRQHHYNVAGGAYFKNFIDENGDFKNILQADVDALLSLYEAAHLGKCDEEFLSNAIVLTTSRLSSKVLDGKLPKPVLARIEHALTMPTHRRMKRLEAKLYISICENDEEINKDILQLAKLDFHILQQMHRDEVKTISLWYKDLDPVNVLGGYVRGRPVECYFWALCIFYEPHYAKARMMFARIIKMFSLFDDTYDSYGTLDELILFNQAVQSWDVEGAKKVGKVYGYVMSHLSKTLDECAAETSASSVGIECTKKTIMEGSNYMLKEIQWRELGQVPSLDEYIKASAVTTLYWSLVSISFYGMGASDDVFNWTLTFPKIIESATIACRLMDDISGHECEKEDRSNCVTAVDCYVKDYGVTVQQAKKALSELVEEHWRIINQELLSNVNRVPGPLLERVTNLVRMMETAYRRMFGYTRPKEIADLIEKLLTECVDHD